MCAAMRTCPACAAKPRHPGPLAQCQTVDTRAKRVDAPDDLVSQYQWEVGMGELAIENMQIGAADAAGFHLEPHFARSRGGVRQIAEDQRGVLFFQDHRAHGCLSLGWRLTWPHQSWVPLKRAEVMRDHAENVLA